MKKFAEIRSEQQITESYRNGMTISGLTQALYYQRKTEDKKVTQKQCRVEVERIILDYLLNLKKG